LASVHEYKRFENSLTLRAKNLILLIGKGLVSFLRAVFSVLSRRYTVVLVPHSEKRVYNVHVTVLSMACAVLVLAGIVGAFFWSGASYSNARGILADKDDRLKSAQASLDQLRDETSRRLRAARNFEAALSTTLSALGVDTPANNVSSPFLSGDLSSLLDIKETAEGSLRETNDMRRFSEYLDAAVEPVKEIGAVLKSRDALLTEIPSVWPIKGGIGHISMFFGQNENPFTGQYYIHKGIDISTYRQGDAIVATADGQVVTVDYDATGFGNYVIIKHKHGFYTRYGHMQQFRVTTGQRVQQGETIGYIGNTGLSTGPHLHYEVHIGSDVVDPFKYLTIRSTVARNTR
jgi:murein DD-endopeptidase MepM/ murein hydrolase activator NlpD